MTRLILPGHHLVMYPVPAFAHLAPEAEAPTVSPCPEAGTAAVERALHRGEGAWMPTLGERAGHTEEPRASVAAMVLIAATIMCFVLWGAVIVWVLVAPENLNADQRFLLPAVALTCAVTFFVYRLRRRAKQRRLDRIISGEPVPPSAWERDRRPPYRKWQVREPGGYTRGR